MLETKKQRPTSSFHLSGLFQACRPGARLLDALVILGDSSRVPKKGMGDVDAHRG